MAAVCSKSSYDNKNNELNAVTSTVKLTAQRILYESSFLFEWWSQITITFNEFLGVLIVTKR